MNKYVEKAPVSEKEQTKDQDQRLTILLRTMTKPVGGIFGSRRTGTTGGDDQGGDQGDAGITEGWQCREETPSRGDRTESPGG